MIPNSLHIWGPFGLHLFGLMAGLALLVGGWLSGLELQRRGLPGDFAWTMVGWAAVAGFGGAKVWAVLQDPMAVVHDPIGQIFSGSGFVWYGGLIGGTLGVSYAIVRHGLPWLTVVDCVAPALAIGQAIGRVGCQLAGDGDWGKVSDVPWAMTYPYAIVGWPYPEGVRVHPTPVYETLAYAAVFAFLWSIRTRPRPAGALFCWYLLLAPGARFVIEFWRINPTVAFGLSAAQLFSLALVALGAAGLLAPRGAAAAPPGVARAAPR
ncbi:MAG: prolipoprotein diacylglyceryl transferase [Candidatus Binatia bacterium]